MEVLLKGGGEDRGMLFCSRNESGRCGVSLRYGYFIKDRVDMY